MVPAVNDTLFPLEPTPDSPTEERGPIAKAFRPYDPHQVLLLPPSLDEWLPEGHLARFLSELVEEVLDLSAIRAALAPPSPPHVVKIRAFLDARNRLVQVQIRQLDRLEAEENPDVTAEAQAEKAAVEDVSRVLPHVELFGSTKAVVQACRWAEELQAWSWTWKGVPQPRLLPGSERWRKVLEGEAKQHHDPFLQLIRDELGIDE